MLNGLSQSKLSANPCCYGLTQYFTCRMTCSSMSIDMRKLGMRWEGNAEAVRKKN